MHPVRQRISYLWYYGERLAREVKASHGTAVREQSRSSVNRAARIIAAERFKNRKPAVHPLIAAPLCIDVRIEARVDGCDNFAFAKRCRTAPLKVVRVQSARALPADANRTYFSDAAARITTDSRASFSAGGSSLPRFAARRRIPSHAFAERKYL
jgi:hypothetical protein